jgi:hypothetical protein
MASVFQSQQRVAREMATLGSFHGNVPINTAVDWVLQTNSGGTKETMFEAHMGRGEIPGRDYTAETERAMVLNDLKIYGRKQGIYKGVYVVRTQVACTNVVRFFLPPNKVMVIIIIIKLARYTHTHTHTPRI